METLFDDESDEQSESEEDLMGLSLKDAYSSLVSASDWTVETLVRQVERGNIDLDPSFQRREAWTGDKQSRFIESLLVGLPIPQIVLAERKDSRGKFLVLDGKQRLLSVQRFINNTLKLKKMDLRGDLNSKTYLDLDEEDKTAFENETMRTVIVKNWQSEDFLYLVFLRLNTASVPLSPQELRMALHPGAFIEYANEYTLSNPEFAQLFKKDATVDFRMRDVEILIRYFAFSRYLTDYDGSLKSLLDITCRDLNATMERGSFDARNIADRCRKGIEVIREVFGSDAFRMWNDEAAQFESRFNRAVFDTLLFPLLNDEIRRAFAAFPVEVVEAFKECCRDERFRASVTSTTKSRESIFVRIDTWSNKLSALTGLELPSLELQGGKLVYTTLAAPA